MKELLDRLHLIFTGIRATAQVDDKVQEGTPGVLTLAGVTVYAGIDKVPEVIPDDCFPYLVIEAGSASQAITPQGVTVESAQLSFGVLVEGESGALFGRNDTLQKGILEWLDALRTIILSDPKLTYSSTLAPHTTCVMNIDVATFLSSDETGNLYSRGFDMLVTYRRPDWTGL